RCTQRYQQHLSYWLERLRDAPAPLDFPRVPRPPVWSFRGGRRVLPLGRDITAALRAYCRASDASQYMVLLAAFTLLLSRYGGQRDLVVGTPVDGRYHPDCEDIIGMFGNSLPIRARIDLDATFDDHVRQVRDAT